MHEHFGGTHAAVPARRDEAADLAESGSSRAPRTSSSADLAYARVDMMRLPDGRLAVSELELIEPGLYLDVLPGNADAVRGPRARPAADRTTRLFALAGAEC